MSLKLAEILVSLNECSTTDEAEVIAEIVLQPDNVGDISDVDTFFSMEDTIIENLIDNLGIEKAKADNIFSELKRSSGLVSSDGEDSDDSERDRDAMESTSLTADSYEGEDSDGEYLDVGECELCDRFIKLTRHHLIPKSTWPRMQTKLLLAAEANERGDIEKARLILGHGLEDLLSDDDGHRFVLSSDKAIVRTILHVTCDICRQCHTTVHRTHTNMELALNYNSIEKLLEDERISKFCKWASKQRSGKYKRV